MMLGGIAEAFLIGPSFIGNSQRWADPGRQSLLWRFAAQRLRRAAPTAAGAVGLCLLGCRSTTYGVIEVDAALHSLGIVTEA